jgi:hypothetical protein
MMVFWPWLLVAVAVGAIAGWMARGARLREGMPSYRRESSIDDDPNN